MKYVITTGWWCGPKSEVNNKRVEYGSSTIREKDFFGEWYKAVNRFTSPEKILIVDSASPIKPDLPDDPRIEWISLNVNAGHSTSHIGKFSGFTRGVVMGMLYAYNCEVDYWVYIEQDALIYGDGIIEHAIQNMDGSVMFGSGVGTPQPMQQSFMIIKKDYIPTFLKKLTSINRTDAQISPEMKFAMVMSSWTRFLPRKFFFQHLHFKPIRKIRKYLLRKFNKFDILPFGHGRNRPISFDSTYFYFQHGTEKELEEYKKKVNF